MKNLVVHLLMVLRRLTVIQKTQHTHSQRNNQSANKNRADPFYKCDEVVSDGRWWCGGWRRPQNEGGCTGLEN